MIIEEGKFYKTRDGRKVGPMRKVSYGWVADSGRIMASDHIDWYNKGNYNYYNETPHDLIEEWKDNAQMFKVGDRVTSDGWGNKGGRGYLIVEIKNGFYKLALSDDDSEIAPMEYKCDVWDSRLKLVESSATAPSSPVQSRKTLVPGVYGRVKLNDYPAGTGIASVQWQGTNLFTANELREVIRVLGEVVSFLEEEENG